jgi:hypothetical protein
LSVKHVELDVVIIADALLKSMPTTYGEIRLAENVYRRNTCSGSHHFIDVGEDLPFDALLRQCAYEDDRIVADATGERALP